MSLFSDAGGACARRRRTVPSSPYFSSSPLVVSACSRRSSFSAVLFLRRDPFQNFSPCVKSYFNFASYQVILTLLWMIRLVETFSPLKSQDLSHMFHGRPDLVSPVTSLSSRSLVSPFSLSHLCVGASDLVIGGFAIRRLRRDLVSVNNRSFFRLLLIHRWIQPSPLDFAAII